VATATDALPRWITSIQQCCRMEKMLHRVQHRRTVHSRGREAVNTSVRPAVGERRLVRRPWSRRMHPHRAAASTPSCPN